MTDPDADYAKRLHQYASWIRAGTEAMGKIFVFTTMFIGGFSVGLAAMDMVVAMEVVKFRHSAAETALFIVQMAVIGLVLWKGAEYAGE